MPEAEKEVTTQVLVTAAEYAGMFYDFVKHNSRPLKSIQERMVCLCTGCEMIRRLSIDDFHFWPNAWGTAHMVADGVSRDDYIRYILNGLD